MHVSRILADLQALADVVDWPLGVAWYICPQLQSVQNHIKCQFDLILI